MNFALISKIFRQNLIQPEKIAKKNPAMRNLRRPRQN